MNPESIRIAEAFGRAIVTSDYDAAAALLAPWLRESLSADALRALVDERLGIIAEANDADERPTPFEVTVDGNRATLESLRADEVDRRAIPDEVTDENFRGWLCAQIECEGNGFGGAFDVWMAVVEVDGAYSVGYFRIEDAD